MCRRAEIVAFQPLSVVESHLWDVGSWPAFLGQLDSAERTTHERYAVLVRHRWHRDEAVITVRWKATAHEVSWQTEQGPRWSGRFSLYPMDDSRTVVALSTTPVGTGPVAWASRCFRPRGHGEKADLSRLKERLDALPG